MGTTNVHFIPYPEPGDTPNIPADMQSLAEKVDSSLFLTQIVQCTSSTRPTGGDLFVGRFIFETDTLAYGIWDGTAWRMWDTADQTYTTEWKANGSTAGVNVGTGGGLHSTYVRRGSRCRVDIQMSVGSSGFSGGVGDWTFTVPFTPTYRGHFSVKTWCPNAGGNFPGYAWADPGSTSIHPVVSVSTTNNSLARARNCNLSADPGTGYPTASGNYSWTTVGDFSIYGEYPI